MSEQFLVHIELEFKQIACVKLLLVKSLTQQLCFEALSELLLFADMQ